MRHSDSLAELAARLSAVQSELPVIPRSKTVRVRTKTGGEYTFNYATLEAILDLAQPVLTKHELAISQVLDEGPALTTTLMHSSGDWISGSIPLPVTPDMSAQEMGSLITYMRRYAVVAILGIATEEDDDGNHASGNVASSAGAQGADGEQPAPAENPAETSALIAAEKAKAAYDAANQQPEYDGTAETVVLPFGKHQGRTLGELVAAGGKDKAYVGWLAEKYEAKTPAQRLVKNAARQLLQLGADPLPVPDDGIPF